MIIKKQLEHIFYGGFVIMDYNMYLPHMDVADGVKRVMNNMTLYMKLLGKFKGREMADTILNAIKLMNFDDIATATHALRGTAANLSFPNVYRITSEIEEIAKSKQDCSHLANILDEAVNSLEDCISKLKIAKGV